MRVDFEPQNGSAIGFMTTYGRVVYEQKWGNNKTNEDCISIKAKIKNLLGCSANR